MTHKSENAHPLDVEQLKITELHQLGNLSIDPGIVYLLRMPSDRTYIDAKKSQKSYEKIVDFFSHVNESATICILSTPPDAATFYKYAIPHLKFQLWVAVKKDLSTPVVARNVLPEEHAALVVFTCYSKALVHTKTRVAYTYCPACGKTTKDYGGKRHLYHVDGTAISDVWRDIKINLDDNIEPVTERLRDLFGVSLYSKLRIIDLRECKELLHSVDRDDGIPLETEHTSQIQIIESQLINDDCINALEKFPSNSVDFCFADLPYNLDKKYDGYDDALETKEYFDWCDRWLSELARITKPGHTCAILNIPFGSLHHYQHLLTLLEFQSWIVWDSLAFPTQHIMPAHYAILCFSKGVSRPLPGLQSLSKGNGTKDEYLTPQAELFCIRPQCVQQRKTNCIDDRDVISDLWHDIHRLKHNSKRVDHPCQLPPALMRRLFSIFTHPGEIILDCFNGAATSTLVAAQMGRYYIGIELSKEYHELAKLRHSELESGLDPFRKRTSVPRSKNSPVRRITEQEYKVSKKTLQLEVKRIKELLGRLPTREDVAQHSRYPFEYYENYFLSWGEVCAAARTTGMTEFPKDQEVKDTDSVNQPSLFNDM